LEVKEGRAKAEGATAAATVAAATAMGVLAKVAAAKGGVRAAPMGCQHTQRSHRSWPKRTWLPIP